MKTLACMDIDASTGCDFKVTGETDESVLQSMIAHAKEHHADKVSGMTDEQMNEMMKPHIKEEAPAAI